MKDQSKTQLTRRDVIAGLGAAAAIGPLTYISAANAESKSPNEKLNIGVIGCGGRGRANMGGTAHENIYAVCDVHDGPIQAAKKLFPDAKTYYDWRDVIADKNIDAVTVSTADHHHALASVAAMRAGKHVYCEKPLAHTVHEARIMQDEYIQRKDKIATQMGTQIHATENYRRVVEAIQAGAIGAVTEAHVWCGRTINPIGQPKLPKLDKPADFHWDVWLGPAANRPYNQGYWKGGNLNWNRRWEFGNGVLGDMGSHLIDLPFWALQLRRPTSVQSVGSKPHPVMCPPSQMATWTHSPRKGNDVFNTDTKVIWYHGPDGIRRRNEALQKRVGADTDLNTWFIGVAFIGEQGILIADYNKMLLSPAAKFATYQPPKQSIPRSIGHHKEWTQACKTGSPTLCNFDYSGALIEHNLLGNVAHRVGGKLDWDPVAFKFKNNDAATALLTKKYRKDWAIKPGVKST